MKLKYMVLEHILLYIERYRLKVYTNFLVLDTSKIGIFVSMMESELFGLVQIEPNLDFLRYFFSFLGPSNSWVVKTNIKVEILKPIYLMISM